MTDLIRKEDVLHDIGELYGMYGDGMVSLEFMAHAVNSVKSVEAIPIEWIEGFWEEHMTYGVIQLMMDRWKSGWMPKRKEE